MKRVLFILKKRSANYAYGYANGLSTGLYNSAKFVSDMLNCADTDIISKMVVVIDNNDIDRAVTEFKPTHVIIEALWVVPEKFKILKRLHPNVTWIIRLHSETAFISQEGMALDWIFGYLNIPGLLIGVNSRRFKNDLEGIVWWEDKHRLLYMPNYYPTGDMHCTLPSKRHVRTINVGCFGAIRPLKNQLAQAIAAIKFADSINVNMDFHINADRVETKGLPVLHNLEALFEGSRGHSLVKHKWLDHGAFLSLLDKMDLCMQVSFSESFNIVAADSISRGVPTVVSREVPWAGAGFAEPTNVGNMVSAMKSAWVYRRLNVFLNQRGLDLFSRASRKAWTRPSMWENPSVY